MDADQREGERMGERGGLRYAQTKGGCGGRGKERRMLEEERWGRRREGTALVCGRQTAAVTSKMRGDKAALRMRHRFEHFLLAASLSPTRLLAVPSRLSFQIILSLFFSLSLAGAQQEVVEISNSELANVHRNRYPTLAVLSWQGRAIFK